MLEYIRISECLDRHLAHQVVGSRGEWSVALIILVLVDMNGGEDLVLQAPGDQLGQPVGVGCEDSLETLHLGMSDVFFLQEQSHLHILGGGQISELGQDRCHSVIVDKDDESYFAVPNMLV